MRGMRETVIFKRRVPMDVVSKSFLLVTLAALLVMVATLHIIRSEDTRYLSTMFEVTSAFGTVGLSVGDGGVRSLSALFTHQGKLFMSLIMLIGRLGPLTFGVAVIRHKEERFKFPEGRVVIG